MNNDPWSGRNGCESNFRGQRWRMDTAPWRGRIGYLPNRRFVSLSLTVSLGPPHTSAGTTRTLFVSPARFQTRHRLVPLHLYFYVRARAAEVPLSFVTAQPSTPSPLDFPVCYTSSKRGSYTSVPVSPTRLQRRSPRRRLNRADNSLPELDTTIFMSRASSESFAIRSQFSHILLYYSSILSVLAVLESTRHFISIYNALYLLMFFCKWEIQR